MACKTESTVIVRVCSGWSFAVETEAAGLAAERATKAQLEKAMQGHVLEKFELIGTYQKD